MTAQQATIFYSWQSDLPNATNRGFIQLALENAARAIRADESIQVEPVIDRDTAGVPGSPEIANTIFGKIARADIFVADVSIINPGAPGRPMPNPNVLVELGYALHALGPERVVLVCNTAFGPVEVLPFDLRMRRAVPYHMPQEVQERATERRRLEGLLTANLSAIFATMAARAVAAVPSPPPIGVQAREAVEDVRANQAALARRYMGWLAGEIRDRTPHLESSDANLLAEALIEAISGTEELVVEFAALAEAIAGTDATEPAQVIYEGFAAILDQYSYTPGASSFRNIDFDFAKFMGYELFVTFFAALIRSDRWALVGELLSRGLYVTNAPGGIPQLVSFDYVSQYVELVRVHYERLNLNWISPQGALINERHTQGALRQVMPMEEFVGADYFLFLRAQMERAEAPRGIVWRAWSIVYMRHVPSYLVRAASERHLRQLLPAFNVDDIDSFRHRLAERAARIDSLFSTGFWHNPMDRFDLDTLGSRP